MDGEAVIRALANHVESWELTGEPRPRLNNSLRGLASLPVRVTTDHLQLNTTMW